MTDAVETELKPTLIFSQSANVPASFSKVYPLIPKFFEGLELKTDVSVGSLKDILESGRRTILVLSLFDRDEFRQALSFFPLMKQAIRDRRIIVVAFSKISSEQSDEVLLKAGCHEVLQYDLSSKAFLYKLKRYVSYLQMGTDTAPLKGAQDIRVLAQKKAAAHPKKNQVNLIDAIEIESDFWLFQKKVYAKKYLKKWLIEVVGPSPAVGKWVLTKEFDSLFKHKNPIWKWVSRDSQKKFDPIFDTSSGVWVFSGLQPEYNWSINRWGFISDQPELSFIENEKVVASKFKIDSDSDLDIASNSEFGIEHFNSIKETFDYLYYIQSEGATHDPEMTANIPWHDQVNSMDLSKEDWESEEETSIPLGAEAMKACGITARLKDVDIEMCSYSEKEDFILLGVERSLIELQEIIEVDIESKNLKESLSFRIRGMISEMDFPQSEQVVAKLVIHADSKEKTRKIRQAVERRQEEIFLFFDQVRGVI